MFFPLESGIFFILYLFLPFLLIGIGYSVYVIITYFLIHGLKVKWLDACDFEP
jgi:hypothetical protein